MEKAKFQYNKQERIFRVKSCDLPEKFKIEEQQLRNDFSKRGMLQSGPYLVALLELYFKQTREIGEIYMSSLIEAIEKDKFIDKCLQDKLSKLLIRFLGNKNSEIRRKLEIEVNRQQLGNNLLHSIELKQSNKYIQVMNLLRDKLYLEIDNKNEIFKNKNLEPASKKHYEKQKRTYFVDLTRINELRSIQNKNFDLSKLIRLCEELNKAYINNCFITIPLLVRTILDHIPPIFKAQNFKEFANNYSGDKSFKKAMIHLENSLREIANLHLHKPIRKQEGLPTFTQVNFSRELDLLLSEIYIKLKEA